MIINFRHKGLKQLFKQDNPKAVNAGHVRKIKQILALLDTAEKVDDLDYTTFRLHPLKGDLRACSESFQAERKSAICSPTSKDYEQALK